MALETSYKSVSQPVYGMITPCITINKEQLVKSFNSLGTCHSGFLKAEKDHGHLDPL